MELDPKLSSENESSVVASGNLSENAIRVLERRYLKRGADGELAESPDEMFKRVAKNIVSSEKNYGATDREIEQIEFSFYKMMSSLEFLPNSPTLMNAGRDLQQLSACFVLPVEDSMESIFDTVRDTALIHKSGGGTGFSFSKLRANGSRVQSTNGVSSGPVSFMRVFDAATESVKQGGTRRGANMGILKVDHPDIESFITAKHGNNQINNFNISVAVTESFMNAVESGSDYNLIAPNNNKVVGVLNARDVFNTMVESAWKNGDPGIIFIDRINKDNPTPHIGEMESTNPCGEQPLLPYEACNLGSINLVKFYDKAKRKIDWPKLKEVVHLSVRFLDNVIDMNKYPIEKIADMTQANRKIGLGLMGWADLLIMMSIKYNSDEALSLAAEVMKYINDEAKKASYELTKTRGTYPNFKGSAHDLNSSGPQRNATVTTIAPTGTISIIAGCSSGIEPLFALSYIRNVMDNDKLVESYPLFESAMRDLGLYSESLAERIAFKGHIEDEEDIPQNVRDIFVTAHGISPIWHIKMQAAFQKHIDNAVSKTVNFGKEATKEDVAEVYMLAYKLGVKGVTIYRDGSKDNQVLSTGSTYDDSSSVAVSDDDKTKLKITARPRPEVVFGSTHKINTGCGAMYVTINCDENGAPFELFTHIGKAGGCAASQTESIGRLVSMGLRSGIDVKDIQKQLLGISCHLPSWDKGVKITSCADAIAKAIGCWMQIKEESVKNGVDNNFVHSGGLGSIKGDNNIQISMGGICPDCAGSLEFSEGCLKCQSCGYTKC
ncbi:MAG: vitamin B12-dependent ribonucleotide reductase [Nitrospinota bacterium]